MFTIKLKGKQNPKNRQMVKIELVFFKTGFNRVPKILNVTGDWKMWDVKSQLFKPKSSEWIELNQKLNDEVVRYQRVAEMWESQELEWTPVSLSHYFDITLAPEKAVKTNTFNVMETIKGIEQSFRSKRKMKNGKVVSSNSNADNYVWLLDSLVEFTQKKYKQPFAAYTFAQITTQFLTDFTKHTIKRGKAAGNNCGLLHKLKLIRAVCNYARNNKIYNTPTNLFDCVSMYMIAPAPTPKTVSYDIIRRIERMDRTGYNAAQSFYIDLFLFSFYTGGMANVDVCHLTRDMIHSDTISYERRKCIRSASPVLIDKAKAILGKYQNQCYGDYALPVFSAKHLTEETQRRRVEQLTVYVNKILRRVCDELHIKEHITWYSARGTFITKMIDEGYNPVLVANMAGNSPAMIYKHYYKNTQQSKLLSAMNNFL